MRGRGGPGSEEMHTNMREETMEDAEQVIRKRAEEGGLTPAPPGGRNAGPTRLGSRAARKIRRNWLSCTAVTCVFFLLAAFVPFAGGCSSGDTTTSSPPLDTAPSVASLHEGEMEDLKTLLAGAPTLSPADLRAGLSSAKTSIAGHPRLCPVWVRPRRP